MTSIDVHLVRHGRVASHRGDTPLVDEGRTEIISAGERLMECLLPGEEIHILCTPTVRSRDTAEVLNVFLKDRLPAGSTLLPPREEPAIRNPDLYLAGRRVEMVSTPEAMAGQVADTGVTAAEVEAVPFFHGFFRAPDRIGYWLNHAAPRGDDPDAVGRRVVAFSASLQDRSSTRRRRYVCVTHSPVMRAVLVRYLHTDPGEPEWVERIDLTFGPDGHTICFRDQRAPLGL